MSKIKLIMCVVMTFVLCIMTLGYAALQERIDVEVRADIDSTYRVEITRVQEGITNGDARSVSVPSYNNLTSTFNVGLTNDTDYITYTIEVTNYSTVDVILNNTEITSTNDNMKILKIGISNGDIILAGGTKTFTLKVKLDTETSNEETSTITINLDFTRLKGGTGSVVEEVYDEYEIGDIISFAGSNWYVIEDSGVDEDYVIILKKKVLTDAELGGYAAYSNQYVMKFGSTADYGSSTVKEMLEGVYLTTLELFNLKEVDGYKIRLITKEELEENLGYVNGNKSEDTPIWVYNNFGEGTNNVNGYWTMSKQSGNVFQVWKTGALNSIAPANIRAVRPVINLYKSAID